MTAATSKRGWVPDAQSFGARLALVRYTMGWNLKEAALACGFSATTWRGWELQGYAPRDFMAKAQAIVDATDCDLQWLIGIDAGPFNEESGVVVRRQGLEPRTRWLSTSDWWWLTERMLAWFIDQATEIVPADHLAGAA